MPKQLQYRWAKQPKEKQLFCKKEDKDKNNLEKRKSR